MSVIGFDARDPLQQHPAQDAQWVESRRFRRQLEASAEIHDLAADICRVHFVYEGWQSQAAYWPWPIHKQAAEIAVRSCSVEVQACATTQLEGYAVARFDNLAAWLASCDATPEARVREIKRYARELVAVHAYHLRHEQGRHALEVQQFEQGVLDGLE